MHRLLIISALSLGYLSLVPQAHADAAASPTKSVDSQSAAPQMQAVYLEYIPFDWGGSRSIPRQEFADGLRNAVRNGLDKAQAGSTRKDIIQLTAPADIQALRTLLKDPQCSIQARGSNDTRLLFEADGGKTQIFVDTDGVASQGSHSWRLTSGEFVRLTRMLDRIYAAPAPLK